MLNLLQLHEITNRILDAGEYDYGVLYPACNQMYNTLVQLSGINTESGNNRKNLWIETGNAIGLTWAAMCIKDIMRTKRFADGIYKATKDVLQKHPHKPVEILYTGTGPFATLILPLTARFSSKQLQLILVEVNPDTCESLKNLLQTLGLMEYVKHIELADATKWKLPDNCSPDIFICETMQLALKSEPQVALCMNIVPQLPAEAILIPQQIVLKAGLMQRPTQGVSGQASHAPEHTMTELNTLYIHNMKEILLHTAKYRNDGLPENFPAVSIQLPIDLKGYYPELYVLTDIQVYDKVNFKTNESQLTMPLQLSKQTISGGEKVSFHYKMGKVPGLVCKVEELATS